MEELIKLAREMNKAQEEENDLALNKDEVAFYDALGVNDAAVKVIGDETLKKIAVELTETIRNSITIEWVSREDIKANIREQVKRLLRKYDYPPDKQKEVIETVMEQAELMCDNQGEF
ncbi:MAG: type I restriction enzyme endonuclease domain-containing protein [Bacillota bacterium]